MPNAKQHRLGSADRRTSAESEDRSDRRSGADGGRSREKVQHEATTSWLFATLTLAVALHPPHDISKPRIRLFSHSTYSTTHLKSLRVIYDINKGLEKIGKTRFGTMYWAGYSLLRCLPPIKELIQTDVIDVDSDKLGWFKQLRVAQDFELQLQQLVHILEPIARAIKCLEGVHVTVVMFSSSTSPSRPFCDEVCSIVNRRYDEMIHGPSGDLFLSGFFPDPEHVKSPLLFRASANQLAAPAVSTFGDSAGITDQDLRDSMPSYTKVGKFLLQVLAKELQAGRDAPVFQRYSTSAEVMNDFKLQFEAYTRQYPPFNVRSRAFEKALDYWRSLQEVDTACVLAFVAIKIFSILANSMAEERTVSRFTRTDTRDRANQRARTIVAGTQVYQHNQRKNRTGKNKPKVAKAPCLTWRSVQTLLVEAESKAVAAQPLADKIDLSDDAKAEPRLPISLECQAGLDALNAPDDIEDPVTDTNTAAQTSFDTHRDGVDTRLPFFRDLLADKPVDGANAVRGIAEWSEVVVRDVRSGGSTGARKFWDGEAEKLVF
ncbi:hypothetical protein C8R47DRAFT_1241882 [Mycena vitilis]|nr:hypothetical protein C8R47DRAFT_1241882 [Mycena vitilis]